MSNKVKKKLVVVVDDDPSIHEIFKKILEPYKEIKVLIARNAGEILKLISSMKPDAIILDLMMPYGDAKKTLKGGTDPQNVDTGVRVIRRLREKNKDIWVSVVTARNAPPVIADVKGLLGQKGRMYFKPADDLEIENDLCLALGLKSKVSPSLLGANYRPPSHIQGGNL
jgi:CheY-like chemotaxis protein